MDAFIDNALQLGLTVGTRILGAILLWIVGKLVIKGVLKVFDTGLQRQKIDPTIVNYMKSAVSILLNVILVVLVLGIFGVETTTLAGLLAAAGVAIGLAWSGLLSNFAAGVFMVLFRPFKTGDLIEAGGVLGVVREIGMFVTTVDTPDNVRVILGNNKIFSDNIRNFNANPYRRVDLQAQLAHDADHQAAIDLLKAKLAAIPNVLSDPGPDVEMLTFTLAGPVLAVRPYTHTDNYWQVYFDTNRAIREELGKAGFSVPETHHHMQQAS